MNRKFIKNKESFICEKCAEFVRGDGYTNHCPSCLWSKHVDLFPGDRLASCLALMEPKKIESFKGKYRITHDCIKCKQTKINDLSAEDSMDCAISIATKTAKKFYGI